MSINKQNMHNVLSRKTIASKYSCTFIVKLQYGIILTTQNVLFFTLGGPFVYSGCFVTVNLEVIAAVCLFDSVFLHLIFF